LLNGGGYEKNLSIKRYFDHYKISKKFASIIKQEKKPDLIVVSIPCYHLAYQAVKLSTRHKIPIVVDFRDEWPDIFLNYFQRSWLKLFAKIILLHDLKKVRYCFKNADSITAVSQLFLESAVIKGKRDNRRNDRVFFLGSNPSSVDHKENSDIQIDSLPQLHNKKIFVFVGSFGHSYDLEIIIDAAEAFKKEKLHDAIFLFIGSGEQDSNIRKMAGHLSNVIFVGWNDSIMLSQLLRMSYAGLMPYVKYAGQSLPTKLFDYFSRGLPVISSLDNEEIKEIVIDRNTGLLYKAEDKKSFYRQCRCMYDNPDKRKVMSENALQFYTNYGNSEKIYQDFAQHIKKML
jgi:glycosyltransferase involved in cell wall biosynthesis